MERDDNESFYYRAGIIVGRRLGLRELAYKQKVVSRFKESVDANGGINSVYDLEKFIDGFLSNLSREEANGKRRHRY